MEDLVSRVTRRDTTTRDMSSSSSEESSSSSSSSSRGSKRVRRTGSSAHLISEYKKLLSSNKNNNDGGGDTKSAIDNALERLNQADQLLRNVQTTQEASLDSRVMVLTGRDTANYATGLKLHDEVEIDIDQVITGLRGLLYGQQRDEQQQDEEDEDDDENNAAAAWEKLGNISLVISRRVGWSPFILGPLSFEKQHRIVNNNRAGIDQQAETATATAEQRNGTGDHSRVVDNTTLAITNIYSCLQANKHQLPINLFKLIINPSSFSQSVENLFYVSFLVHEARVRIYEEPVHHRFPLVDLVPPLPDANLHPEEYEHEFDIRSQMVASQSIANFDMYTFHQAIMAWNITGCTIIPNR